MNQLYYQPEGFWFGDCMPYGKDGEFYLFHQRDTRNPEPLPDCEPFGWDLAVTKDFVSYKDMDTVIPVGAPDAQDQFIFAGSICEVQGMYHAFYTGYNREYPQYGKPSQVLMEAVSKDLIHWEKRGEALKLFPQKGYDETDWRDPFVVYDEDNKVYVLILGARLTGNKNRLTGRTVYFTSENFGDWVFKGDFWAPDLYTMHEMPDLFQIGDWWYLITTEYSDKCKMVYRMGKTLYGPWTAPFDDAFDGRAYYAGRTFCMNGQRILFGWVPTRAEEDDHSNFIWGGTFVAHEIFQRKDGTLGVKVPDTVWNAFGEGKYLGQTVIERTDGITRQICCRDSTDFFSLEGDFKFSEGTRTFGLSFMGNEEEGKFYQFSFYVLENKYVFEKKPNMEWPSIMNIGLERPILLKPEENYHIQLIVDDTIATLYVNGVALNTRMYEKPGQDLSLFVCNGRLQVLNLRISREKS